MKDGSSKIGQLMKPSVIQLIIYKFSVTIFVTFFSV